MSSAPSVLDLFILWCDVVRDTFFVLNCTEFSTGKWQFVRYFLLKKTLNPKKRFFICWELVRCVISILRTITAICSHNLLVSHSQMLEIFNHIFDASSVLDLYVRMHCQYYNENGILVTHPWACVKYYMKTGFVLDFYTFIPIKKFRLAEMFGESNTQITFIMMMLATRPLQLHRLMSALSYLESDIESNKTNVIQTIKFSFILVVLLGVIATLIQIPACKIYCTSEGLVNVICANNTWLTTSYFRDNLQPAQIFLEAFYFSMTLLTTASSGVFTFNNATEILLSLPILFLFFMLRWYILAKLTSARVSLIS